MSLFASDAQREIPAQAYFRFRAAFYLMFLRPTVLASVSLSDSGIRSVLFFGVPSEGACPVLIRAYSPISAFGLSKAGCPAL